MDMSYVHAEKLLNSLGKKWVPSIILELNEKKAMRFTDIKKEFSLSSVSLTKVLSVLYKNGIIEKGLTVDVPIQAEYILTEFGKKIAKLVKNLNELTL